ncbi:MAG: amino acid ABC transporter permease [Actinomycetota bacterium]
MSYSGGDTYGAPGTPGLDPRAPSPGGGRGSRILGGGEGTRSVWVAVLSTVLFFVVAGLLIVRSPGWSAPGGVRQDFFDAAEFRYSLPRILDKFWRNVLIFCVAEAVVLAFALLLAVMRSLPGPLFAPLRVLATSYTILFRGLPTILVISMLGYGMPALDLQGIPNSPFFWAIVSLVLVYSAYVAEVYRAGIESIHPSQTAAARSLGLTRGQAMRHVILPQAIRRVIPPLMNDFIGLQKDSALVAFLGVTEGLLTAQIISANDFNFTSYTALALVYVLITVPQVLLVDWLIKRDQRQRQAGGVG